MKYGQLVCAEVAYEPAECRCPRCGGLVTRYRSADLDDELDWFAWECRLCARVFRVTRAGVLVPWSLTRVAA
jgi:hypothetical protein